MTGFGKFLVTVLVSFFLMIGALGSTYPTFLIILAILAWLIFFWNVSAGNARKERERDETIRLFNDFLRSRKRF